MHMVSFRQKKNKLNKIETEKQISKQSNIYCENGGRVHLFVSFSYLTCLPV